VASGGRTPRFITPGPDGRWLYALNEDSDTVTTFAVDPENGTLTPTGRPLSCGSPVCLVFHRLPA
jgi:6-phosphogluconolactonase (cycloisomerase 2 family)